MPLRSKLNPQNYLNLFGAYRKISTSKSFFGLIVYRHRLVIVGSLFAHPLIGRSFRAHYYQATSFAGGAIGAGTACQELWSHRSKFMNVDRCVTNFTNEIQMRLIEKT